MIAIVDFDIKDFSNEECHTIWKIREEENKELILTNDLEIHIIEMKKARKVLKDNKNDKVAQWMSFFDNPNSVEVKNMGKENEDINEALEQLRRLSANEELVDLMERQDRYERDHIAELQFVREEGLEEGIQQGKEQTKIEIAKKMLKKNKSIQDIMEITELSEEEIIKLKQK